MQCIHTYIAYIHTVHVYIQCMYTYSACIRTVHVYVQCMYVYVQGMQENHMCILLSLELKQVKISSMELHAHMHT